MGAFDRKKFHGVQNIAASVTLCRITDYHLTKGKQAADGSCGRDMDWFTLALEEPALDTDGETLPPGFFKEIAFGSYDKTEGDEKKETSNRICDQRIHELVVAALDLPTNIKDSPAALEKAGGTDALLGKRVGVCWSVTGRGMQNVDQFLKPAALIKKA